MKRVYEVSEVAATKEGVKFIGTRYDHEDTGGIKVLSYGMSQVDFADKDFVNDPNKSMEENVFEYAKTIVTPGEVDEVVLTEKQTVGDVDSGIASEDAVQPALYSAMVETVGTPGGDASNTSGEEGSDAEGSANATTFSKKVYAGKAVLSDTFRSVEGKSYHHIKLEDGTTYDLTNEEYAVQVTDAQ